jgi:hypothetical protein
MAYCDSERASYTREITPVQARPSYSVTGPKRLGRTRESVRLLAAGERGPGGFPAPVSHLRTRNRLWRWSDVAVWARVATPEQAAAAKLIAAVNAALELRHAMGGLGATEQRLVRALAAG